MISINHFHLKEVSSTQNYLKDHLLNLGHPALISTDFQSSGHGRQGSLWKHFPNALAFSFSLSPGEILTLTPLEIGGLLCEFFSDQSIFLKWPNDLLNNQNEKIGGIMCELIRDKVIIGVGFNLYINENENKIEHKNKINMKYKIGSLFKERCDFERETEKYLNLKKELPLKIYHSILRKRQGPLNIKNLFLKYCMHINKSVIITDRNHSTTGIFKGIGENGEALIQERDNTRKILTGSLHLT